jgi:hypothetical protein
MRGRIKVGALITQDFATGRWPAKSGGSDTVPDIEFDCKWNGSFWECIADGYGMLGYAGEYGNGSVFVHDIDGVIASSNA